MILFCKCGTQVSKDLKLIDTYTEEHNTELLNEDEAEIYRFNPVVGYIANDFFPNYRNMIPLNYYWLHFADLVDGVLQNTSMGCCHFDGADVICNNCGLLLGEATDDCWQDAISWIEKDKVDLK